MTDNNPVDNSLKIVQFPDKILSLKADQYDYVDKISNDKETAQLMAQKIFTMKNCIGLAAPQIGIAKRFFVIRDGLSGIRYCFNPVVVNHGRDIEVKTEGCMSLGYGDRMLGGVFVPVPRWRVITARYVDLKGILVETTLKGLDARAYQHEMDHINGLLIIKTERDNE